MAAKKAKDGLAILIAAGKPKPGDEGEGDEEALPEEEGAYPEEGAEAELAPEEEESEGAYPEFTIPEGLDLSDIEPGEEKQVLCVIGKTADDTACIKQVDGVDLGGAGVGMYGPPPAAPAGGPPPGGLPPPGLGGPPPGPPRPPGPPPPMMMGAPGGPPPGLPPGLPPGMPPGGPIRRRAAARGLM